MNKRVKIQTKFSKLPTEIYIIILDYMKELDAFFTRKINKEFNEIISNHPRYNVHFSMINKFRKFINDFNNPNLAKSIEDYTKDLEKIKLTYKFHKDFDEKSILLRDSEKLWFSIGFKKMDKNDTEKIKKLKCSTRIIKIFNSSQDGGDLGGSQIFEVIMEINNIKISVEYSRHYSGYYEYIYYIINIKNSNDVTYTIFEYAKGNENYPDFIADFRKNMAKWINIKEYVKKENIIKLRKELNILDNFSKKLLILYFLSMIRWMRS